MILTKDQQDIYDGKRGRGAAMAMQILSGIGKCFDAPKLVPVTKVHVSLSAQEADTWFAKKLFDAGAKCEVSPTVNPGYSLDFFENQLSKEAVDNMERNRCAYSGLGARLTYCCTPYLYDNIPEFGEICAISETNATIYVNSVLGARTNRESAASALCAAITGLTPEYGMHLKENRRGTVKVLVKASMKGTFSYSLLGLCGKKIGRGIPVFYFDNADTTDTAVSIDPESLIALGATLNVSGNFDLFHIPGITPEITKEPDYYSGDANLPVVTITDDDLLNALSEFNENTSEKPDFVILGCPHYTKKQIEDVLGLLDNRRVKIPFLILTSAGIMPELKKEGLTERLNSLGVSLVTDTCVDEECCFMKYKGKSGMTDSPKAAYYMSVWGPQIRISHVKNCVEASLA